MRARDALAAQLDLVYRLESNPTEGFEKFQPGTMVALGPDRPLQPLITEHARNATVYHVEANMTPVIVARAWGNDLEFGPVYPPDRCGLVLFDEPIVRMTARGTDTKIHALTWGPSRAGGFITIAYNRIATDPDEEWITARNEMTPDQLHLFHRWGDWGPTDLTLCQPDNTLGPAWIPTTRQARDEIIRDGGFVLDREPNPFRLISAIWQLLEETITVDRHSEPPDRATGRRAMRTLGRTDVPLVEVVTLRRKTTPPEHPGTGHPLRWRVPVKEHWRTYHTIDGPVKRRIAVHWRGPEGGPQRVTNKIYNLKR